MYSLNYEIITTFFHCRAKFHLPEISQKRETKSKVKRKLTFKLIKVFLSKKLKFLKCLQSMPDNDDDDYCVNGIYACLKIFRCIRMFIEAHTLPRISSIYRLDTLDIAPFCRVKFITTHEKKFTVSHPKYMSIYPKFKTVKY